MTTQQQTQLGSGRTAWRFFPLVLIGALFFVILVNIGMAYTAIRTFPGDAIRDDAPSTASGAQAPAQ